MKSSGVALGMVLALCAGMATAAEPVRVYDSISPADMVAVLTANGATAKIVQQDGKPVILADTPVGKMEVRFADCAEAPNPCGYILIRRYRGLALTPDQLNQFNARGGFGYAFREDNSTDVLLAYPVAICNGLSAAYIASTFGLLTGIEDVFEGFVTDTLHIKPERLNAD